MAALGVGRATPGPDTAQFEKGRCAFWIAFKEGSKQIEGVNLAPAP
jgi:hypothetical protein